MVVSGRRLARSLRRNWIGAANGGKPFVAFRMKSKMELCPNTGVADDYYLGWAKWIKVCYNNGDVIEVAPENLKKPPHSIKFVVHKSNNTMETITSGVLDLTDVDALAIVPVENNDHSKFMILSREKFAKISGHGVVLQFHKPKTKKKDDSSSSDD